jgi:dGTPase
VINLLANESADIFWDHKTQILSGSFNSTLLDELENRCGAMQAVQDLSVQKIYGHDTVVQVEIAGFNVMSELLQLFVPSLLATVPTARQQKVLKLFPYQFTEFEVTTSFYEKVLNALDYISGMTDEYATELYRRLKGITIPGHG